MSLASGHLAESLSNLYHTQLQVLNDRYHSWYFWGHPYSLPTFSLCPMSHTDCSQLNCWLLDHGCCFAPQIGIDCSYKSLEFFAFSHSIWLLVWGPSLPKSPFLKNRDLPIPAFFFERARMPKDSHLWVGPSRGALPGFAFCFAYLGANGADHLVWNEPTLWWNLTGL